MTLGEPKSSTHVCETYVMRCGLTTEKGLTWDIWPSKSGSSTGKGLTWDTRRSAGSNPFDGMQVGDTPLLLSPEIRFANFFEYTNLYPSGPHVAVIARNTKQKRGVKNWPPHPFGVGWGGQFFTNKSGLAKSIPFSGTPQVTYTDSRWAIPLSCRSTEKRLI